MSYKKLFYFLIVFGLLTSGFGVITATGKRTQTTMTVQCEKPTVLITIVDALYTDLDDDGLEDDVFASVDLSLICGNRFNLEYYITLTLPSGLSFTYGYMINTRLDSFTMQNNFYNHAIESGDYQIDVYIVLKTGGISFSHNSVIFDPPGGTDADPHFRVIVLY